MDKSDFNAHSSGTKPEPLKTSEAQAAVRYVAVSDCVPTANMGGDSIDLLALWRVVMQFKRLLIGIFLFGVLIALSVALLSTPIYRAELIMTSAAEKEGGGLSSLAGQFGGLASLAGVSLPSGSNDVDRVLAILKSRAFIVPFLQQEKIVSLLVEPSADNVLSTQEAYKTFVKYVLDISKDSKTSLITLRVEWEDPSLAARWANTLLARLNEHQRQAAISEAQQSIDYLNQQLMATSVVDMQQAIYRLIEAQTKIIMLANVKKQYAMQVIDPAVVPEKRVRPKRALILVLGAVLSIFIGIFVVFLLHGLKHFKQRLAQDA